MPSLADRIAAIQERKLARVVHDKAWTEFYRRFWATEEGQAHLEWVAAREESHGAEA